MFVGFHLTRKNETVLLLMARRSLVFKGNLQGSHHFFGGPLKHDPTNGGFTFGLPRFRSAPSAETQAHCRVSKKAKISGAKGLWRANRLAIRRCSACLQRTLCRVCVLGGSTEHLGGGVVRPIWISMVYNHVGVSQRLCSLLSLGAMSTSDSSRVT